MASGFPLYPDNEIVDFAIFVYREQIKNQLLHTIDILINEVPNFIDEDEKEYLEMLIQRKKKDKACEQFLDAFSKKQDKQKYDDLLRASDEHDRKLWKLLTLDIPNDEELKRSEEWKKMVKGHLRNILKINFQHTEVLENLVELKTLPRPNIEEIEKIFDHHGNCKGVYRLVRELPKTHDEWYINFLAVLLKEEKDVVYEMKEDLKFVENPADKELSELVDEVREILRKSDSPVHPDPPPVSGPPLATLPVTGGGETASDVVEDGSSGVKLELNISIDETPANLNNLGSRGDPEGEENIEGRYSDREVAPTDAITTLELRSYQAELARHGIAGYNCVIFAPTGSGKTHVAMKIAQEHLKAASPGTKKVAFLVPTKPLVDQQSDQFTKFLGSSVKVSDLIGGDGAGASIPLPEKMAENDIIVMTAQILVNSLKSKFCPLESIRKFSLIIFDECHHCDKEHPYNEIMRAYFNDRSAGYKDLPQIIGLTASLGTNKAGNTTQALEHVLEMCANIDTQYLLKPPDDADFLNLNQVPEDNIEICRAKYPDNAGHCLQYLMKICERKVAQLFGDTLPPPDKRGSQKYTNYVNSDLKKAVLQLVDRKEDRIQMDSCISCLDIYHRAIIMGRLIRSKDAKAYIEEKLWNDDYIPSCRFEEEMKEEYNRVCRTGFEGEEENPALSKLKTTIHLQFGSEADSRVLIFVKERAYTTALCDWFKENIPEVAVDIVVGAAVSAISGGQTQNIQQAVLNKFRTGAVKTLICTSILEEGLDVPECNLVIRYGYVTNETAMVQSKGRGRALNAKYVVIVPEGEEWLANKEKVNKWRNSMMQEAANFITSMSNDVFRSEIRKRQELKMKQRDLKLKAQREIRNAKERKVYNLECSCGAEVCSSADIRVAENAHHVVLSDDIIEKLTVKLLADPRTFTTTKISGSVICAKCQKPWGSLIYYRDVAFPNLKICNFILINQANRKEMLKKKKWKDAPFNVKEIEFDEILSTLDRRGNTWVEERALET